MKMKKTLSKKTIYLFLILGAVMMSLPFIWLILSTFKTNKEIMGFPPTFIPNKWTFENYIYILKNLKIPRYFMNSLFLAGTKTIIGVYTSLLCGYVLAKFKFRGRDLIFQMIIFTMMVPYLIMVIPLYDMINFFEWSDSYIAIILPVFLSSFGIFMMRQYLKGIPNSLIEAARIDGASEFMIFHKIVIPLSVNMISALSIFLFLWNWEDFLWPYLVLTTQDKYPLAVALNMFSGQNTTNFGGLFAATAVTIIPILVVYLFAQKRFVEGVSMSGIK